MITETWLTTDREPVLTRSTDITFDLDYDVFDSGTDNDSDRSQGVAFLLKKRSSKRRQDLTAIPGRAVAVHLGFRNRGLLLVAPFYPIRQYSNENDKCRLVRQTVLEWTARSQAANIAVVISNNFNGVATPVLADCPQAVQT